MADDATHRVPSVWHSRIFVSLWVASLDSNIGTFVHSTAAQWLMTDIASGAAAVALLAVAAALPVLVLSLHAGALADVVDRRRLLLVTQTWMLVARGARDSRPVGEQTSRVWHRCR